MALQNLKQAKNTAIGIVEKIWLAPVDWFISIKCPASPFTDPGDEVTIWQDHLFKAGKAFIEVLLAPEKNQINATTIGDLMFQKMDQQLEVFIPGSYPEVHEFAKNIINTPLIVISKDSNCDADIKYQLGCDCTYAYMKMDFTTGTTRDGVKGYKGIVTYLNGYIQLYNGSLPVQGAINGLSPVFLADAAVHRISGNVSALETLFSNAQSIDISTIYSLLLAQADEEIISVGFATNNGDALNEYLVPVDLSSESAFITSLYDWLQLNGDTQFLEADGEYLKFFDISAASGYFGIAVPQFILGDDDIILIDEDGDLILTE